MRTSRVLFFLYANCTYIICLIPAGDTIDLAYDSVYRSWPCLKNKSAIDKGSFSFIVLTFSHFVMIEVNGMYYFDLL